MTDESGDAIVHLLLGSMAYYPTHDNTMAVLSSKDRAEEICEKLNDIGGPDSKKQYQDLSDEYDCLPERHRPQQKYTVESYEVHDD